ncbi:MAG: hypothetical protein JWQ71_2344 [Pedosphaera sp.]|nr:hypothetical protein [Pedosphaera sp.]
MGLSRRARKILLGFGIFILLVGLALVALPLWLPWILGPVGKKYGFRYAGYERVGYQRFALTNVSFTNQTMALKAKRLEGFVPTVWLWNRYFSSQADPKVFLNVKEWQLNISEAPQNVPRKKPATVYNTLQQVDATLATLRDWLPTATLTNGMIQTKGASLQISNAVWKNGALITDLALPKYQQGFAISFKSSRQGQSEIHLDSRSLQFTSDIRILQTATALNIDATNFWQGNPIGFHAVYNQKSNLPEEATLQAPSIQVPASLLGMNDYQDLTGSLSAKWQQDRFSLDVDAHARPAPQTNAPPIDLLLHAKGDTGKATIETAKITAPWLTAELSGGVNVNFQGPFLTNKATLNILADLDRQHWIDLHGMAKGQVVFTPTSEKYPIAAFNLTSSNIEAQKIQTKSVSLSGELLWPVLQSIKLEAQLADGSLVSFTGGANLEKKTVQEGHLQFEGSFGRQFLPRDYSYDKASASISLSGSLTNISHSGLLKINQFTVTNLYPQNIQAKWDGKGTHRLQSEIELVAGSSALTLQTSLEAARDQTNLTIKTFTLKTNGEPVLQLEQPCQISLSAGGAPSDASNHFFLVKMAAFNWLGKDKELRLQGEVDWPKRGVIASSVHALDSSLFNGFFVKPLPEGKIEDLNLSANWTNGPVNLAFTLSSTATTPQGIPIAAKADVNGNGGGMFIKDLLVSSKAQPIFSAKGFLPIALRPDHATNWIDFLDGKPLQFQAMTETNSIFWSELASLTGIALQNPRLNVNVAGSLKSPQGDITVRADSIKLPEKKSRLPTLDNLQVAIKLDRSTARINQFTLSVQGQPISATAEIPLGEAFWANLRNKKGLPNWQKASAQLIIKNAQISAFASLLPTLLAPEGQLNANISLHPGIKLEGKLTIDGVQTRPLGAIGPLRDIKANLEFVERTIDLKATVSVGGELVFTQGRVDLQGDKWLKGNLPLFDITVHGTNVPLARKPEIVLRGDINLAAAKTNENAPLVSGTVQLHDSFLLQAFNTLIPGRVSSPSERPPYFSISDPLLADWKLNVSLLGERFLKIQNPLFKGEASITMKVLGPLKNPVALGDVRINTGTIQFPFGNLQVSEGFVTLASENPHLPQLQVSAAARQFGYDIKLDVTGPADHPLIQFTSVPPLSSEQILLMLTTGQLPRNDFSFTPQQRVQALALYLGKNLLSKYGFGGDTQRLTVKSGQDISEEGKPTYNVEYQLTPKWSLVGEYDRFGNFNGSFKWKIYSK